MASRSRHSTVQPTPRASRSGPAQPTPATSGKEAPPYEQPSFTLNPSAQRALANLKRSHDLQKLNKSLDTAQITLSEAAVDINVRFHDKRARLEKLKAKTQKLREQNESAEDHETLLRERQADHDDMQERVDNMTQRMEEAMRKLVDGQEYVGTITQSLDKSAENARNYASTQASTLNSRTQRPRRSTRGDGEEDEDDGEEDEDEEIPDFQPTDPAAGTQPGQAPVEIYMKNLDETRTHYMNFSNFERYSGNEKYVNYRRAVHDAAYPDDDIPLPPKEAWFNDDGTVAPVGYTRRPNEDDEDSDDDLAVSRATISTKCPLTLKEFVDPLTSKKCDHSFEATAIMEMLRRSDKRIPPPPGHSRNVQAVQCPASGCSQMLSKEDLHRSEWLIGKIKRQQKAKQQAQDEEEDDDDDDDDSENRGATQRGAQRIDSDDDDAMDIENEAPFKLKAEPQGTGASAASRSQPRPSDYQPPQPSMTIDLLDDDDDDEEEDELYE